MLGRTPPGSPPKMAESVLTVRVNLNHTDDSHDTVKTEAESGNGRDALDETRETDTDVEDVQEESEGAKIKQLDSEACIPFGTRSSAGADQPNSPGRLPHQILPWNGKDREGAIPNRNAPTSGSQRVSV